MRAAETTPTPEGFWQGELSLPTGPLQISVHFTPGGDSGWSGAIDVPAQGTRALELKVVVAGSRIRFSMSAVPGNPTYTGTLSADGTALTGEFQQGNAKFPFSLRRTTEAAAKAGPVVAAGIPGEGLTGHWLGVLKPNANLALRLELDVRNPAADQLDVMLICLDQQNARMPAASLREHEGVIRVEFARPVAAFEGRLNADGSELTGTWTQNNRPVPLTFKRQPKSTAVARPQEPVRPLSYAEHEAKVEHVAAEVTLAGTLTVPTGPGPHPAVVLLSGSGPQDRDHQVAGHRTFLVLADYLTRQGFAVLRYDERGVGQSTGKFATAIQGDFIADALAAVAWLRARQDVDPKRVGLIGLKGGMIAPRIAAQSADVAFIVLLAGPGLPLDQIMVRQARDIGTAMGSTEAMLAQNERVQREIFAIARSDLSQADVVAAMRKVHAAEEAKLSDAQRQALNLPTGGAQSPRDPLSESPWFRDALRHDPRTALQAVKCPVLALTGEKDLQVSAKENLPVIEAALQAGGNRRFKVKELPGLNHLLQTCRVGAPYEYAQIAETISPLALQEISRWLIEVTTKARVGSK